MKVGRTVLRRRFFNPLDGFHRFARLSCMALVAGLTLSAPIAWTQPQDTDNVVPWKDRFGNPLPFQSDAEIIEFMRTAEIELVEDLEVGVTDPRRVELVKDGITMRAVLRDFEKTHEQLRFQLNFYPRLRDSFLFDIAAYELSRMLGLNNIPPVTLRRVNRFQATLQIWLEDAYVEKDRYDGHVMPPDVLFFHKQRQNMLVFDSVIGNVDRNLGNVLYDEKWNHWLIDHSRAFPPDAEKMLYLDQIEWCSRYMYETLREFDYDLLEEHLSPPLGPKEIDAILKRRDIVVARLDAKIAERGEEAVLF